MIELEQAKKNAAKEAIKLIKANMIVGLGSGSTSAFFIEELIKKQNEGVQFKAVCSSLNSQKKALSGKIEIIDINDTNKIDITVDGADEVDLEKKMIKGAGGAHVREKILASSSKELVIIVDETKKVSQLGKKALPIEVLYFGSLQTKWKIEQLGFQGKWRYSEDGNLYLTDNGNLILDAVFLSPPKEIEKVHTHIKLIPGVIDTGFFFNIAHKVIVGKLDGSIEIY